MKYLYTILLFFCVSFVAAAQAPGQSPVRTAEEEAMKQTEMLQRELQLTPAQHDTIYQIHLRYAKLRRLSNTRQEALERMNAMTAEILAVLTKSQQQLFLGKQIGCEPRRPQTHVGRICRDSI